MALSFLPWAPTVDGQTIPGRPIDCILAGAAADIDLLVGTNTEETRLFLLSDGSIDRVTEEALSAAATAYRLPTAGLSAYRAAHPGGSAGDLLSSDAMHQAWVSFATGGDCGWPKYDPVQRLTMRFDTTSHVVEDPLGPVLALWKGVR